MHNREISNIIRQWYRQIDKRVLWLFIALAFISVILVSSTSPVIAAKVGVPANYFVIRQIIYLIASFFIILLCSVLPLSAIRRVSIVGLLVCICLLIMVNVSGYEVKGAKRWISILGFSMQPSELIKPFLSITFAWLLSIRSAYTRSSLVILALLYLIVALLIIIQPDLGMLIIITACFSIQLFASAIPYILVFVSVLCISMGMLLAYLFLPHVTERLNSFFVPKAHANYQVSQSLRAFEEGGAFGQGPGEGNVKELLPDSHCDFIFAVAGEELGIFTCIIMVSIFAILTIRFLTKITDMQDKFSILGIAGLISQIALQAIINMGVSVNLLPTKGMTLPFISYGGSSSLAIAINLGFLLSLSKKRISYE